MPSKRERAGSDQFEPEDDDGRSRPARRRKPADADDRIDYEEWVDEHRSKGRKRRDKSGERHRQRDDWEE